MKFISQTKSTDTLAKHAHWTQALLAVSIATAFAPSLAQAQGVPMTGPGSYSENFDALPSVPAVDAWLNNSTLPNWYAAKASGLGNPTVANIIVSNGSLNSGAIYSFGTASATERALGSVGSGTPSRQAYGVLFNNTSASTLVINSVTYTGEQWRNGGNATPHKLEFSYQVNNTAITAANASATLPAGWSAFAGADFTGPIASATAVALDGNLPANKSSVTGTPTIVVPAGQYAFLRWFDPNDDGNDHGLAIDDLTVSWITSVSPILGVTATPPNFPENTGPAAASGTITIPNALPSDLVVTLTSSDITEATVPATVTILAGTTSIPYTISAVNDFLVDGPQGVTISAAATGYLSGSFNLTVEDDNDAAIVVAVTPTTFAENAGPNAATGTVTVVENVLADLTVTLFSASSDIQFNPLTVTILAGTNTAAFSIDAINNNLADGTRTFSVRASAPGYVNGFRNNLTVTDDGDLPPAPTISVDGIAFTGYNADGADNLAFVALVPIAAGDIIFFTDNEWNGGPVDNGGGFNDLNEGVIRWTAPVGGVAVGSIVRLDDLSLVTASTNAGALLRTGNFSLAAAGDTVYAVQGSVFSPTRVLAAISALAEDTITGTGLTELVLLADGTDIAAYKGLRNDNATYPGYLTSIFDEATNWDVQDTAGDNGIDAIAPDLPFSSVPFTLTAGGNTYAAWASTNNAAGGVNGDHDNDGVKNAVEFFMGATGSTFTLNPAPDATRKVTFPQSTTATDVTGLIQTSPDLVVWTTQTPDTSVPGFISYTLPPSAPGGKLFLRLNVVVAP